MHLWIPSLENHQTFPYDIPFTEVYVKRNETGLKLNK